MPEPPDPTSEATRIVDGLALWEEHKPETAEDWLAVASRFNAAQGDRSLSSPLFAALSIAVEQRDTQDMRATMAEEVALEAASEEGDADA